MWTQLVSQCFVTLQRPEKGGRCFTPKLEVDSKTRGSGSISQILETSSEAWREALEMHTFTPFCSLHIPGSRIDRPRRAVLARRDVPNSATDSLHAQAGLHVPASASQREK